MKVINITKGVPDDMEKARNSAQEIMNMSTPINVGNILLFNAQISADNTDIIFPVDRDVLKGYPSSEFLFDISSELTTYMVYGAKQLKFDFAQIGSKALF